MEAYKNRTIPAECTECGFRFRVRMPDNISSNRNYIINYQCPRCGCRYSVSGTNQEAGNANKRGGGRIAKTLFYLIGISCAIAVSAVFILYFVSLFVDISPLIQRIKPAYENLAGIFSGVVGRISVSLQDSRNRQALMTFLPRIIVMLTCSPIHECAHAWTAYKLGDSTGKLQGRITLNPFKHLDPYGAIMILLVGVGYAKPVPVNPNNFKNKKCDMAITAFAGPFSNMVLAVILLVVIRWFKEAGTAADHYFIIQLLIYTAFINICLAVFNMIPFPPLDGSKVIGAVLPDGFYSSLMQMGPKVGMVLFLVIILCSRMGYSPISAVSNAVFDYLYRLIVMGTI